MLELGDKINPAVGTYKDYFTSLGVHHTSIDWNGNNGAINRDLRKPITDLGFAFDVVTNIGTTEHVSDQYAVWQNMHTLCRPGGFIVSVTPFPGGDNWWWHGEHYPTYEFFQSFANLNDYSILKLGSGLEPPNKNVYCLMAKGNRSKVKFKMPPEELMYYNKMRPR